MKLLPAPPTFLLEAVGLYLLLDIVCGLDVEQSTYAILCTFFVMKVPSLLTEIARLEDE